MTISLDDQITIVEGYSLTPEEDAILASLQRLKAIEEAEGRPEEPEIVKLWRRVGAARIQLGVAYIDALSAYADHWRAKAEAAQVDAERYRQLKIHDPEGQTRCGFPVDDDPPIDEARKK